MVSKLPIFPSLPALLINVIDAGFNSLISSKSLVKLLVTDLISDKSIAISFRFLFSVIDRERVKTIYFSSAYLLANANPIPLLPPVIITILLTK